MKKLNKNQRLAAIVMICIVAIAIIWCFVASMGGEKQQDNKPVVEEQKNELSVREKVRLKIPLTQEEKRQLVKEMSGDMSRLNTKPVEDKGF